MGLDQLGPTLGQQGRRSAKEGRRGKGVKRGKNMDSTDSRMRFSGWKGLNANDMMVSVKVNLLTLVPVSAFHIVMTPGLSMTASRSLQESCTQRAGS